MESQQGDRECDRAVGQSQAGRGFSRWMQYSLSHGLLLPGDLLSGAVPQAERQEADPSWHKEIERPPGPQWTDWTAKMGSSKVTHTLMIKSRKL